MKNAVQNELKKTNNMKITLEESNSVDQKSVSLLAYQLWEQSGRPAGQDMHFWLEAEKQLRATITETIPQIPIKAPTAPQPMAASPQKPKLNRRSLNRRAG
jgi:hypothetical protein